MARKLEEQEELGSRTGSDVRRDGLKGNLAAMEERAPLAVEFDMDGSLSSRAVVTVTPGLHGIAAAIIILTWLLQPDRERGKSSATAAAAIGAR
ncbi:hypothetical protein DFH27DRAFT_614168 [Peziza echinospora]|nr:hypothetical protein DFH27DRAFT_614168 [Peziza echinospora]